MARKPRTTEQKARRNAAERKARSDDTYEVLLGTIDFETDPFLPGRIPRPFAVGYLVEGQNPHTYWGEDCAFAIVEWMLDQKEPLILYAHNGGRFDFHFIFDAIMRCEWLGTDEEKLAMMTPFMIGNRIVKMQVGKVELRDSFAIIPAPLSAYKKDEFDYSKMEADVREQYKDEIIRYLTNDLIFLKDLVEQFWSEFGDHLTIGSCSMNKLSEMHAWDKLSASQDDIFRRFYFGGRVECFETGEIHGSFSTYDINSQYPYAMSAYSHPLGCEFDTSQTITDETDFAVIDAHSKGCLPTRGSDGNNCYDPCYSRFWASGHEIRAALKLGLLKIDKVQIAYTFKHRGSLTEYVEMMYAKRVAAKLAGHKGRALFYKFALNVPYGKFGQNPRNWREIMIIPSYMREHIPHPRWGDSDFDINQHWRLDFETGDVSSDYYSGENHPICLEVWSKPSPNGKFNNVATAASITGAARARLMEGLASCTRPLYCDTDSIICERLGEPTHDTELGRFKNEGDATACYIYGKKMYALVNGDMIVKAASKGVLCDPQDIIGLVKGRDITYSNQAPAFRLGRTPTFTKRTIKALAIRRSASADVPDMFDPENHTFTGTDRVDAD